MSDDQWAYRAIKPRKGYEYRTPDGDKINIRRVASDGSWADILVVQTTTGATWTKRQPLRDGLLPFEARIWSTERAR